VRGRAATAVAAVACVAAMAATRRPGQLNCKLKAVCSTEGLIVSPALGWWCQLCPLAAFLQCLLCLLRPHASTRARAQPWQS